MRSRTKASFWRASWAGFAALAVLSAAACRPAVVSDLGPRFSAMTVHRQGKPIHGLVRGELDALHPGDEVACLLADGSALVLLPGEGPWKSETILRGRDVSGMEDRPTIALGDVDSRYPGNEVVVAGKAQVNVVRYAAESGWSHETLHEISGPAGMMWGARVGDYNPGREGVEIFVIDEFVFDTSVGTVYQEAAGVWEQVDVYSGEVGMDSIAADFDPGHAGPEVLITSEMGPTYQLNPPEAQTDEPWPRRELWDDSGNAGWVVQVGDVLAEESGNEVVYGTRYNNRVLVSRGTGSGDHSVEVVFTGQTKKEPRNMWDIALGDVLAESPAQEVVAVDDSGSVYLIWHGEQGWTGETIWTSTRTPLYAVITGDFLPAVPGEEVVVAGDDGAVTLLSRLAE